MPDLPLLAIFTTSFLVGLSGAVSPGPLLAFNIRETVRRGFLAGPYIATGHVLLELVVVVVLALGLAHLLHAEHPLVGVIGVMGGLFLLWMGWGMVRNPGHSAPGFAHHSGELTFERGAREPIVGGVVVSLSNPFWTIWWLSVGASLLSRSLELRLMGIGAFYLGHILADYSWYSLVSFMLVSGRHLITQRVYWGIMVGCGVFLGGMGVYFLYTGAEILV